MSPPWLPLFMPSKTVIHIACGLFSAVRVHIQSSGLYLVSWLHTCLPNQVELQWISHGVSHMTNNTILFLFNFPQERGEYTHKTSIQPVSWDWSLLFCPLCTVVRLLVTSSKTPVSYGISSTITPFFVLGKILLCFGDPFILFSYLICYYHVYGEESVTTL